MPTIDLRENSLNLDAQQFLATLIDFGPGRLKIFATAPTRTQGTSPSPFDADVTEGSSGIWRRLHYDWSDPERVVMTTTELESMGGRSGTPTPSRAGSMERPTSMRSWVCDGKNLKGGARARAGTVGEGVLARHQEHGQGHRRA